MAKSPSFPTWTVLPHGPLEQLEDNLWRLEGSLPNMPLRRVMTVARRATGGLLVHNPIALDDTQRARLEALGAVEVLVVPNGWHRLDLHAWHARYPSAVVVAPAGSLGKVAEVEPGARELASLPPDPTIELGELDGTKRMEAVMIVRSGAACTLVFCDAVFNMPHLTGVKGFVLRHLTQSSGGPKTSRIARLLMIKDRAAFAAHLDRLAALEPRRIIVAHHEVIERAPGATLRQVAASLR